MVDWLFWWFPYAMPMFAKDGVVLWLIIGGAVARTQDRFMRVRTRTLKDTLYTSLGYPSTSDMQPDTSRYLGRIYNNSPRWLRILIDLFLWPRVVGKFFRMPFASIGKTKEYTWYDVYNSKLEHDKTKEKDGYLASFDLRIVFFIQVLMIIMAAFFVLSFDSFAMPLNIN